MNNILLLTKIYPAKDLPNNDTKVVHYFAKEWKKMGYNVLVVHNFVLFPPFVYWITRLFSSKLAAIFGAVVPTVYDSQVREYEYDGIDVVRIPLMKYVPHGMFSDSTIKKHYNKINNILKRKGFVPDYVIGHWWNPQLQLFQYFKNEYNTKNCLVVHEYSSKVKAETFLPYFKDIDVFGMRSMPIKKIFDEKFGGNYKTFHCASGIPDTFVVGNGHRTFEKKLTKLCYVGTMIKRKYPISLLYALDSLFPSNNSYTIDFVGSGSELSKLMTFTKGKKWAGNVKIHGQIPREQVSDVLKESDCFIMISKQEAFGLVYLEAMGCGCIPIASRNEGMDGIIVDGQNGFLCEAGNHEELSAIIEKLNMLSMDDRRRISDNAVKTAAYYTDILAAKRYIENVINL